MHTTSVECHVCCNTIDGVRRTDGLFCPICGTDLFNWEIESTQRQENGFLVKSRFSGGGNGVLYLTNRRLIFINKYPTNFAPVVALLVSQNTKGWISLDVPPGDISNVSVVTYAAIFHALLIMTSDNIKYRVFMPKKMCNEWRDLILRFNASLE